MAHKEAIELSALIGKSSRTYQTRKFTGTMVASKTHVAIALWDIPWKSAPHGKLHGWIIVIDTRGKRQFIKTGRSFAANPNKEVLADFLSAIASAPESVWVTVGRRQSALGNMIRKQGFAVTGSFVDENRAIVKARNLRKMQEIKAKRRARKSGEQPQKTTVEVEVPPTCWLPNRSSFAHTGHTVRIATDASSDTVSKGTMCFVANNGDFQLRTKMTAAGTDELELETITLALRYARKQGFSQVIIETDSVAALEVADHILSGGRLSRKWRGVSSGARSRFLQAWQSVNAHGHAKLGRVLGHAGDPLNHAADRIAYLGLRASNFPEAEAAPTAWAEVSDVIKKLKSKNIR